MGTNDNYRAMTKLFDNHDDAVVLFPLKVNNDFFQPVQLPNNGAGAIRFEQFSPHGLIHFECSQFTTLNVDKSVVSSLKQICTFRLRSLRIFPKMNQECSSQMIQIIFILTNCTGGVS